MAKGTVNKVIIIGRLGQDPDVKATASGTQVVTLNVATNELGPQNQDGGRQERTEWHRITLFGRLAENAGTYLSKGSQVYLEGRLRTSKWQDQQGNDRYSTEIIAQEMQFLGGRLESDISKNTAANTQSNNRYIKEPQKAPQPQKNVSANPDLEDLDDIPF